MTSFSMVTSHDMTGSLFKFVGHFWAGVTKQPKCPSQAQTSRWVSDQRDYVIRV